MIELERASDGKDLLPDLQVAGLANRDRCQRSGRYVDLQDGDVIGCVESDQSRGVVRIIRQSYNRALPVTNHMKIGDDIDN